MMPAVETAANHEDAAWARDRLQHGGRLLVTRLRFTGDAILSLPLLRALDDAFPRAELHYLAEPASHAALRGDPSIDVRWLAPRTSSSTLQLARALRSQGYVAAIDLFCNTRSALLVRATGARVRIGEARRIRRRLYTCARVLRPGRSALEQHLGALLGLGITPPLPRRPDLHLTEAECVAGRARLGERPVWLVHLGATQPAKEWPLEHAVALVEELRAVGIDVVLGTVPGRSEPSAEVARRTRARTLDAMPLREYFGVVAGAAGVVTVDGAVAHAAVALGRPTVALFGPTDPTVWFPYAEFGPYRVLHAGVECGDCDRWRCPERRCMAAIEPDRVVSTVLTLLHGAGPALEVGGA